MTKTKHETVKVYPPITRDMINNMECIEEIEKDQSLFVVHKGKVYYGYSQMWFEKSIQRAGGCGPICGLNILNYNGWYFYKWQRHLRQEYKKITNVQKMDKMYLRIKPFEIESKIVLKWLKIFKVPRTMGVYTVNRFAKMLKSYCGKNKLNGVVEKKILKPWKNQGEQEILSFLQNQLQSNYPVAFLNTFVHTQIYTIGEKIKTHKFQYHWVLITGMYKLDEHIVLKCSTWGKVGYFYLEPFFENELKVLKLVPCGLVAITEIK